MTFWTVTDQCWWRFSTREWTSGLTSKDHSFSVCSEYIPSDASGTSKNSSEASFRPIKLARPEDGFSDSSVTTAYCSAFLVSSRCGSTIIVSSSLFLKWMSWHDSVFWEDLVALVKSLDKNSGGLFPVLALNSSRNAADGEKICLFFWKEANMFI